MGVLHSKKSRDKNSPTLKIVLLGLENAGKTTFLRYLKRNENLGETLPTIGLNIGETFMFEKKGLVFDVGGKNTAMWNEYSKNANVVIFIVDCSDFSRMVRLQEELLNLSYNIDAETQIVFLLNKIDLAPDYYIMDFIDNFKIDCLFTNDMFFERISVMQGIGMNELVKKLSLIHI